VFIVDRDIVLDFSVFSPFLVVSTSATDCLERLVSKMTYYCVERDVKLCSLILYGQGKFNICCKLEN